MVKLKMLHMTITLFTFFLITNCCTTKTDMVENKGKKYSENVSSLSPGSAKVSCNLLEVIEDGNNYTCKIKIVEVYGYGSATMPISVGTSINAGMANNLEIGSENLNHYMSSSKILNVELKQQQNRKLGAQKSVNWLIVGISEK